MTANPADGDGFLMVATWAFRLTWVIILMLHALCSAYYLVVGRLAQRTPGSMNEIFFAQYSIDMPISAYPTITGVHYALGAVHILLGGFMVVWSIIKRRCSFGPLYDTPSGNSRSKGAKDPSFNAIPLLRAASRSAREMVETALQTQQAYLMSRYLARPWLNRFFIATLVVNCWSVPIIHLLCHRHKMLNRLLSLICDGVLDLVSSIGVSTLLMASYYKDYDSTQAAFNLDLWVVDEWFVRIMTEFQIMMVASWSDLVSRVIFAFGLILCLENIKDLVRERPARHAPVAAVAAIGAATSAPKQVVQPRRSSTRFRLVSSFRQIASQWQRRLTQAAHAGMLVLGLVVLGLHIQSESIPSHKGCVLQLRTWTETRPACALVRVDCYQDGHTGSSAAVIGQWQTLEPVYVRRVMAVHCQTFEMPATLQSFNRLVAVKMYNSTIASWEDGAALTATHTPMVVMVNFARVNVTGGQLPAGLMSPDFPPMMLEVTFCISNLNVLPTEAPSRWNLYASFSCERCQFTTFPAALKHWRQPFWISLADNPLTTFPWEVFAIEGLMFFQLSDAPLTSFSPDPYDETFLIGSTLLYVFVHATNVTYLPRWVDAFIEAPRPGFFAAPLDASMTPLRDAITAMHSGSTDRFPEALTQGVPSSQISSLMYLTRDNISAIDSVVMCSTTITTSYPLALDDTSYSLDPSIGK
ncbi:hypothetical protein ATCC90586_004816 [Pythium insidiosum]|nr:hypothetical protein ATCC90586_004816 [Pythium insidiosum]